MSISVESLERRLCLTASPANLGVVATSLFSLQVSWSDATNDHNSFVVQRRVGRSGSWRTCATPAASENSYTDGSAVAGVAYSYRVAANGPDSLSPWSTSLVYAAPVMISAAEVPTSELSVAGVDGQPPQGWINVAALPAFAADGPSAADVYQGTLGNCSLQAALAVVAQQDPGALRNVFHDNRDGTYDVFLWMRGKRRDVRIDGWLPAYDVYTPAVGGGYGRDSSTWLPLLVKAAAILVSPAGGAAYKRLEGILPNDSFAMLGFDRLLRYGTPGAAVSGYDPTVASAADAYAMIARAVRRHEFVLLSTWRPSSDGLAGEHTYSVFWAGPNSEGDFMVELRDPNGGTGPNGNGYWTVPIQSTFDSMGALTLARGLPSSSS